MESYGVGDFEVCDSEEGHSESIQLQMEAVLLEEIEEDDFSRLAATGDDDVSEELSPEERQSKVS